MKSLTPSKASLGFIGMGAMGSRLARRLRDQGYTIAVYDRSLEKAEALLAHGIAVVASIGELSANADVILSCLTDGEAVNSVYLSPEGVLATARPGTVLLEMSTISPQLSRQLSGHVIIRGMKMMDVSISGSTPAVEQGTVTLLAGGDAEVFEAAEPIFQAIAKQWFLIGPAGSGSSMKLVVNALLGVGMQAIAEAVSLGDGLGIERQRLLEVLSKTAVISPAHIGKLTKAEHHDYSPQFPLRLMNKDFRLVLHAAHLLGLSLPATAASFQVNSAVFHEDPDTDFSSVIRHMEKLVDPALTDRLLGVSNEGLARGGVSEPAETHTPALG